MKLSMKTQFAHVAAILVASLSVTAVSSPASAQTDGAWLDEEQTEGTWIYMREEGESHAMFGSVAQLQKFVITCSRASGQLRLSRPGSPGEGASMRIRTETMQRELDIAPLVGMRGVDIVFAGLRANDRLLDAMAITKGRFAVETDGLPTLYLPAWAEVSRVIEDCR